MFGHTSKPSKIFSFGCKCPHENLHLVEEQIFKNHLYRNKLVEIEKERRQEVTIALETMYPKLEELNKKIDDLADMVKIEVAEQSKVNAKNRKRIKDEESTERRKRIKDMKKTLKEDRVARKDLRNEYFSTYEWKQRNCEINEVANDKVKSARKDCGLYWGNYLTAERSIGKTGAPPKFHRLGARRNFQLMVQIQHQKGKGLHAKDLFSPNPLVYLTPIEEGSSTSNSKRSKKKKRYNVKLRVGSDSKGKPIFTTVRTVLHRPIPDGAVKQVFLIKRKVATTVEWKIQFVVSNENGFKKSCATDGSVTISVSPKVINCENDEKNIQVATWQGSDGAEGKIVLSSARNQKTYVGRQRKVSDLRQIRDKKFDAIRNKIVAWKKDYMGSIPDWFSPRTKFIHLWKSQARLASLILFWRQNRFDGDQEVWGLKDLQHEFPSMFTDIDDLEEWRKKDKHLYDWEGHQGLSVGRFRDNLFKEEAARLAQKYRKVILTKVDWSLKKRKAAPEREDDHLVGLQRWYLRIAAPGRLTEVLKERFAEVEERTS